MELDLDLILKNLIAGMDKKAYFILITTENGVVMKSYINEDEFNKASISVNISQLYEIAEEVTEEIGIHAPDFNIIHSDNFYIISIKIMERIIILLTQDQVEINKVFEIINKSTMQA
jgi:predicted regulator of Ras-like GTPase activity (Roadblock/LC7/MglB family)